MIPIAVFFAFLFGVWMGARNMRTYTIKEMQARERSNWSQLAKIIIQDPDRARTLALVMAREDAES